MIQNINLINKYYPNTDESMEIIKNANGIFVKKNYKILKGFSSICNEYKSESLNLESVNQVNNWINNNTNGLIKEALPSDFNLASVKLMLINALFFKGNWRNPFKYRSTIRFRNYDNTESRVYSMENMDKYLYYQNDKIQMISIPYIGFTEMIIILPRSNKYSSAYDYINEEKVNFSDLIRNLKKEEQVELYLPEFQIEYEEDLKTILTEMGMKIPFSKQADFGKINNEYNMYIKDIIHKTFIKVDKYGTEAAAATIVNGGIVLSADYWPKYYMIVDHSFIFLITNKLIEDSNNNNLILFLGVVNNLKEPQLEKTNESDDTNNKNDYNNNDTNNIEDDYIIDDSNKVEDDYNNDDINNIEYDYNNDDNDDIIDEKYTGNVKDEDINNDNDNEKKESENNNNEGKEMKESRNNNNEDNENENNLQIIVSNESENGDIYIKNFINNALYSIILLLIF